MASERSMQRVTSGESRRLPGTAVKINTGCQSILDEGISPAH